MTCGAPFRDHAGGHYPQIVCTLDAGHDNHGWHFQFAPDGQLLSCWHEDPKFAAIAAGDVP